MRKMIAAEVWKGKTLQFAISVMRLMELMRGVGEVELRSPPRAFSGCGKPAEVVVERMKYAGSDETQHRPSQDERVTQRDRCCGTLAARVDWKPAL